MIASNDDEAQLAKLKTIYGAEPTSLDDVVLLTPEDKLEQRRIEYPGIDVHPLKFCSAELQAGHWKFLMGAIGNQAAYNLIDYRIAKHDEITPESIRKVYESAN